MLPVRDIMTTDVLTVAPQTTLRELSELLAARHVGGAPVISGGRVVGVVSSSDVLAFLASTPGMPRTRETPADWEEESEATERQAEAENDPQARYFTDLWEDAAGGSVAERMDEAERAEWDVLAEHTVSEAMTFKVLAVPPSTDVSVVAARMRTEDVHRLLVMERGRLLGIVTTTDLARAVADGRVARRTFVFDRSPLDRDHDRGAF